MDRYTLDDDLEGGWGNSVGLNAGRRWDNWFADMACIYQYQKYTNPNFTMHWFHHYIPVGLEESFAFLWRRLLCSTYTISSHIRVALHVGLAWRRNSVDATFYDGITTNVH